MKHFCVLPWIHLVTRPSGKIQPCCRFQSSEGGPFHGIKNVKEAWDSPFMHNLREQMRAGTSPRGCIRCYQEEASNTTSLRQKYNRLFDHVQPTQSPQLESLEIALGNKCNLACVMCDSFYSTKWIQDEKRLGYEEIHPPLSKGADQALREVDLSQLKYIKFMGGEPLLYEDQICDIIEQMDHPLRIEFSTNVSRLPSKRLQACLQRTKDVRVALSIDAVGPANEYIRYGSRWHDLEKNVSQLRELLPQAHFFVHSVIQVLNVFRLSELETWIEQHALPWSTDLLFNPAHLSIQNLPDSVKEDLSTALSCLKNTRVQKRTKDFLFQSPPSPEKLNQLYKYLSDLDRIRGLDHREVFPEIQRAMIYR